MGWFFGFEGRINRAKYLVALLVYAIPVSIGSMLIDNGAPGVGLVMALAFCFMVSMPAAKRLHDLNHSGWWQLLGLIPIVNIGLGIYMLFWKGGSGPNRYGRDPLADESTVLPAATPAAAKNPCTPSVTIGLESKYFLDENQARTKVAVSKNAVVADHRLQKKVPDEDAIFEMVANELERDPTDKGLWTRLYAEHDGDEKKTKVAYIKQRSERLLAAERARLDELAREEAERVEKCEKLRLEGLSLRDKLAEANLTPELEQAIRRLSGTSNALAFFSNVRLNKTDLVVAQLEEEPLYVALTMSDGSTPLHCAASEKYLSMSKLLIEKGARPDRPNTAGQTPLDIIRKSGRQELIELYSAVK